MRKKRYVVKQRSRMILRIGILALGALLAIGLVFGLIHLLKSTKKGAKELTELPLRIPPTIPIPAPAFFTSRRASCTIWVSRTAARIPHTR